MGPFVVLRAVLKIQVVHAVDAQQQHMLNAIAAISITIFLFRTESRLNRTPHQ